MEVSYKRKVLFKNKDVEVVVIDWKPGDESPVHQHGTCAGIVKVIKGTVYETGYVRQGKRLVAGKKKHFKKGSCVIERKLGIHQMGNDSKMPARTLNIYLPRAQNKEVQL